MMEKTAINPKTVLVTGAGGACARESTGSLPRPATLSLHRLDLAAADRAAEAILAGGGKAAAFAVDVANESSVRDLKQAVEARFGIIDGLINAAGILDRKYLMDHDVSSLSGPWTSIWWARSR